MSEEREQCPMIHPVEGVRCEKWRGERHDEEHRVSGYWSGGDALRWSVKNDGASEAPR